MSQTHGCGNTKESSLDLCFYFSHHMSMQPEKSNVDRPTITVESVLTLLHTKIKPEGIKTKHSALFILIHAIIQDYGFRVVGLGESGNIIGTYAVANEMTDPWVEEKKLPAEWNASNDSWSFRYRHFQSSFLFIVKV